MSEIAPTYGNTPSVGAGVTSEYADTFSHIHAISASDGFSEVPSGASLGFYALIGSTRISPLYLHIRHNSGSQATIECRVAGTPTPGHWSYTAAGATLYIYSFAVDSSGNTLTTELLMKAVIESVNWDGSWLTVFSIGEGEVRPPRTFAIEDILFTQERSGGQRSVRFPVIWGIQAGDIITNGSIADLTIGRLSITITPSYKVIDVSELI
jgi:hypothetical protein